VVQLISIEIVRCDKIEVTTLDCCDLALFARGFSIETDHLKLLWMAMREENWKKSHSKRLLLNSL
jgi:hypothetical protein